MILIFWIKRGTRSFVRIELVRFVLSGRLFVLVAGKTSVPETGSMQDFLEISDFSRMERRFKKQDGSYFFTCWHILVVLLLLTKPVEQRAQSHCNWYHKTTIMNAAASFARTASLVQRAAAKRTTTPLLVRSFSSKNEGPQKLTKDEVAASVRLLTYQGTPFPWVAVSFWINYWSRIKATAATIP